ncbi:sugar phosphate isomerase/epimerase family protein [Fontivita pretiosa]|uniref:sugar phosphate isomerase/epimerase family protein n=1 Tax=Fontivita pretiosa TaxID=2989684 RepID=UPI003D18662A
MRFAFSTVACPKWDFETIAARAREYGYDGVEIRGFLNETVLTVSNVFLTDPAKVRSIFAEQGVQIACLASSIAMTGQRKRDQILAEDCRRYIDTAAAIGCEFVRVLDTQVKPGQSRAAVAAALAEWLVPLGDYAADRHVCLLIENALSFRSAKEMWMILEQICHPAIGCCWDVANAAMIGESPAISVPVLNSRIDYVHVKDAKLGPLGVSFCKLGEGDIPVQKLLIRLMGIGYQGWVTVEWEKAWLPGLAEPEEILPDAVAKLKQWTKPQVQEKPAKKEAHAKPAAAGAAAGKAPAKAAAPTAAASTPSP